MTACGLDFGTSNSAIGVVRDGTARLAPIEAGNTLIPSAVFFDYEVKGRVLFGNAAIAAYVGQTEGRLMRALKSLLGSALIDEETSLGRPHGAAEGRRRNLRAPPERQGRGLRRPGRSPPSCSAGRCASVDDDDAADRARAGRARGHRQSGRAFATSRFVYEPIAAAHHYEQTVQGEELALIADIGGGTSDFSIVRVGAAAPWARADRRRDVLATAGRPVWAAPTSTPRFSLAAVMPALGLGTRLIEKNLPVPNVLYHELGRLADHQLRLHLQERARESSELVSLACEPEKVERLLAVVRQRLGHRLAFAVEDAKIVLERRGTRGHLSRLSRSGPSRSRPTRIEFDRVLEARIDQLYMAARECIAAAGLGAAAIDTLFLTGGSSRVPAVRAAVGTGRALCPSGWRLGPPVRRVGIDADGGGMSFSAETR